MVLDPRVGGLIGLLVEAGLAAGDNPVIVQDEDDAEYRIVEVNHETGDIAIILAAPDLLGGPTGRALLAIIDEYADAHAIRYWNDDQGSGPAVASAHQEEAEARARLLEALGVTE